VEDWKCPGDKPNKYCGHEQGTSCVLSSIDFCSDLQKSYTWMEVFELSEEPGGVCASTEPDHKCCNGNLPFVSRSQVPILHFRRFNWGLIVFRYPRLNFLCDLEHGSDLVPCWQYDNSCTDPITQ
ncbi:hypothetical protein MJO29_006666, partial [Puccinia striiformis f. sp. tritici]